MTPLLAQTRPRMDRAFERMYKRHVLDVYRYALVVLRSPEDAEDVTQTTFMNAYRAFQRGERPRAAQNWLISIAHNVCRQRFRQSSRRPHEVELEDEAAAVVPDEDGVTAHDIRRALGHLAFNQRAALVMREIEGRSYPEIAEILNLTVGAVETLVFRARRALREQLEGSLTCHEAERAISRQLDGRLPRPERGALRAHLRECQDCARFARSQRAQRTALRAFAMVPLPSSLASFFGTTAAGGGALAAKGALLAATGIVATGVSYEGAKQAGWTKQEAKPKVADVAAAPAAAPASAAVSLPARPSAAKPAAPTSRTQPKLPGFVRNADKPGRRVGPKEPVRTAIIERKTEQAVRKAARREAKPAVVPARPSRPKPAKAKRRITIPPPGQLRKLLLPPPPRGPKR
jgi:RNA polymerase sigma-70 factor, ECF subfamily